MSYHTVFVVPYRDRANQLSKFKVYFDKLCKIKTEWGKGVKLLVIEQVDERFFNRGATKNIGAIHARRITTGNPTIVFHDVDTLPLFPLSINFDCQPGVANHIYGCHSSLGGIFSIKLFDFLKSGGFPNIWGWGYEDNILNNRILNSGIYVDRSKMIGMQDYKNIHRIDMLTEKPTRDVSLQCLYRVSINSSDSIRDINNVKCEIDKDTLKIREFKTKFPCPKKLTTLQPYELQCNTVEYLFPKKRKMKMLLGAR